MTPEFSISLSIAQLVLVASLVWGLAKMSAAVDSLRTVTSDLTKGLERFGESLNDMVRRVSILEDRSGRRRSTDPAA